VASAAAVVVCRHCCGEACSAISEAVDAVAGAEEDSAVGAVLAAAVEDLVAASAEAATLVAEARAVVGNPQ
jgi:hypothetical protein